MISGILLAAGESKRMQPAFKPLLKWGKRTVIGECVHQMRNTRLADIFVVLGHRAEEIRPRLAGTAVQFVVNEDYQKGMLSSVKTGLAMLGPNTDAVMIALVDQPMIKADLMNKLIAAYGDSDKGIVFPTYNGPTYNGPTYNGPTYNGPTYNGPTYNGPTYNGTHGHPIIVSAGYEEEIMQLDESNPEGLSAFINAHKNDWLEVPVETSAVIEDIDTPEDYQRLSKQAEPLYEYHNWHP